MSRSIRSLALAAALAAAGCKEAASGPIAACLPVSSACTSNAECCSYGCLAAYPGQPGHCTANPIEGGWCRSTADCSGLMTCKSDHCTAATVCRDDGDVCSTDGQCCTGNCTTDAVCVRGNSVPVAVISSGPSGTTVPHGRAVTWSGATSYDPDQQPIQAWAWTIVERPAGSTAQLTGATASSASLVPDRDGPWTIQLTVSDGIATSTPVTVSFQSVNVIPTANVTLQPTVPKGVLVTLHGEGSGDGNGDPITYAWTVTVGGQPVLLDLTTPSRPTFTATVADVYSVRLVVNDGVVDSAPVTTTIASTNYAPVANAGPGQVLNLGKAGGPAVTLDGTHSTDQNPGDPMYFTWTLTSRPPGSAAALSDPAAASPTLTPDLPGTYGATLTVSDGVLSSVQASAVTITVLPHLWKLGYAVVDAEYSKPLDRIVAVSATATAGTLHVIDPAAETETTLALAKPPKCVGVSADGTKAVVGYDALVTYVDLTGGTPARIGSDVVAPLDVGDALLGPPLTVSTKARRYAYLFPASGYNAYSLDVQTIATPPVAAASLFTSSLSAGARGVLEPAAGALWAESYSGMYKFPLSNGVPLSAQYFSTDSYGHPAISEHASPDTRIYGAGNGHAVTLATGTTTLPYAGSLTGSQSTYLAVQHMTHRLAGATDLLAVIVKDDSWTTPVEDGELRVFDGLTLVENAALRHALPLWGAGTAVSYPTHGRFVLQKADATARYVILAADAAAPDSAGHAIAAFAP